MKLNIRASKVDNDLTQFGYATRPEKFLFGGELNQLSQHETSSNKIRETKLNQNNPKTSVMQDEEYTIEVLIAVDKKMQEYHGENVKNYVLTLMSEVSH